MSLFPLHSFHTLRFPCLTAIRCMCKVHCCACLATAIAISLDLQMGINHMKQINQIDVKIGELDLATCQILRSDFHNEGCADAVLFWKMLLGFGLLTFVPLHFCVADPAFCQLVLLTKSNWRINMGEV